MIADLWQDMRYGARMLFKNPIFTIIAVLTLALGIGANTAIFSVVNAALLRPLPFVEPERLMTLHDLQPAPGAPAEETTVSFPEFEDWRKQNRVFDEVAALFHTNVNLTGRAEPERLRGALVSQNYFALFGAKPLLGRVFAAEEHQPGANPVVVVSYGAWRQMFGGDAALLGRTLTLNGKDHTVIGVMPAEAPNFGRENKTALWMPLEANLPWKNRGVHFLSVFARLKSGATPAQAQREMDALAGNLAAANRTNHGVR